MHKGRLFSALVLMSLPVAATVGAGNLFQEVNGVASMTAEHCTENKGGWKPVSGGGLRDPGSGGIYFTITFKTTGRYYVHMLGGVGQSGCGGDGANDCYLRFNGNALGIDGYSGPLKPDGYRYSNSGCCEKACWEQGPKVGSHTPAELKTGVLYLDVKSAGDHVFSVLHRSTDFIVYKVVMGTNMKSKPSGTGPAETLKGASTGLLHALPPGTPIAGLSGDENVYSIHGQRLTSKIADARRVTRFKGITVRVSARTAGIRFIAKN